MVKKTPYYLEREDFLKLSSEKKKANWKKIKDKFTDPKNSKDKPDPDNTKVSHKGIQTRYIKNAQKSKQSDDDDEDDDSDVEDAGPIINYIISQSRNSNVVMVNHSMGQDNALALVDS